MWSKVAGCRNRETLEAVSFLSGVKATSLLSTCDEIGGTGRPKKEMGHIAQEGNLHGGKYALPRTDCKPALHLLHCQEQAM